MQVLLEFEGIRLEMVEIEIKFRCMMDNDRNFRLEDSKYVNRGEDGLTLTVSTKHFHIYMGIRVYVEGKKVKQNKKDFYPYSHPYTQEFEEFLVKFSEIKKGIGIY